MYRISTAVLGRKMEKNNLLPLFTETHPHRQTAGDARSDDDGCSVASVLSKLFIHIILEEKNNSMPGFGYFSQRWGLLVCLWGCVLIGEGVFRFFFFFTWSPAKKWLKE